MKTDIIGHRGAAGLALENSIAAIKAALRLGVPAIEIDIRLTADNQLVLAHDPTLKRIAGDRRKIRNHAYKDLREIRLKDDSPLPLLTDALKIIGSLPVIIEVKDIGSTEPLCKVLRQFPKARVSVTSYQHSELLVLKKKRPDILIYATEIKKPLRAIHFSRQHNLGGVALFWGLLNPYTYRQARKANIAVYVWTVNNRFLGWLIRRLYPDVRLCTNYPHYFL